MAQRLGITFRAPADADAGQERRRRLGLVHPRRRRHHAARPGQRVRDGRRRRHVLRAAAGHVDHRRRPASRWPAANPSCKQVARARRRGAPRPTPPAARSASSRRSASATAVPPRRCPASSAAGRSAARPAARRTTRPRRSSASPRRSRRPASPPTRTTRRDGVGGAVQVDVIKAVTDVLERAVTGQPEHGFTPPSQALAFENGSSPAVPWRYDGYGERSRRRSPRSRRWTASRRGGRTGGRRRAPTRSTGPQDRGRRLLDRHAAADRLRLAAHRPRLLLHPHRHRRPLPADARQGGLLPDGLGRQRPAHRAPGAELLRRALRPVAALRPGLRAARHAGRRSRRCRSPGATSSSCASG